MKINELKKPKTCPCCGKIYSEHSALSRSDGVTAICPDCGTREALESIGVAEEEQEKILDIIHQTYGAR
ncbi:MAG: hypothetical protein MSA91_05225 [Lachnobacterium sp.]|nr:hypothetical protein [Lachnobacterium sp.]